MVSHFSEKALTQLRGSYDKSGDFRGFFALPASKAVLI
jgi:hypothetical protein